MKYKVLLLILISVVILNAEVITERIIDNSDYMELTNVYNNDYSYIMSEGMPVVPLRKIMHNVRGMIHIDSIAFFINRTDTITDCNIIPGEDPLPLSSVQGKRSILNMPKSVFPQNIVQIQSGQKGSEGVIYGDAAVYQTDGVNLYHHRDMEIHIYYTAMFKQESKSSPSVLILTEDSLKSSWSVYDDLYPNFYVIKRTVEEILMLYPGTDTTLSIREYAQALYADSNLQAMIVGLDTDRIPGAYVTLQITPQIDSLSATVVTDKYYACLDGNWDGDNDGIVGEMEDSIDIFPDIAIARCPLINSNDVNNFINKIIKFKQGTGDTMLLVASYLDNNTDGSIAMENLIINTPFDEPIKTLYEKDSNLSSTSFTNAINNSPFAIIHDGHGSYTAIQSGVNYTYSSNMDGLTNSRPVLMYTLSCLSAGYDHDCLAEHFFNSPGGGFYIGNSRYGWYTPYFPGFGTADILMSRFFSYFMNEYHNPAQVLNNVFADYAGEISGFNDFRWAFMALTYFGDPLINIYRTFDTYDMNMQYAVKNEYFSFTVPVKDSLIISVTGDSIYTGTLYENSNLFYCPVQNEDSLLVRLASGSSTDTFIIIYPLLSDSIAYINNYEMSMTAPDTVLLSLDMHVNHAGSYMIIPGDIADTMIYTTGDSIFTLSSDTTLHFVYNVMNIPSNASTIPLNINGDQLYLQTGMNMNENIECNFITERACYTNGENIISDINIINRSNATYSVDIELYSDSLNIYDTIYSGTLNVFTQLDLKDTLIADSMLSADMLLTVRGGYQEKTDMYSLALEMNESYYDCESYNDLSVDSSSAYFHLSNTRAHSGTYSFFSGNTFNSTYPRNYITSLTSPVFQYNRKSIFGFSTFYDVEGGFDYCVVSLHSDSADVPVITLSGQSNGWEHFSYYAGDFAINDNDNAYLKFSFFSEDDSYQYEGWYIDDIVLPGNKQMTNLESNDYHYDSDHTNNIHFDAHQTMLYVLSDYDNNKLNIYNVAGSIVESRTIHSGYHSIPLNIPCGVYFIRLTNQSVVIEKKILKIE